MQRFDVKISPHEMLASCAQIDWLHMPKTPTIQNALKNKHQYDAQLSALL
jgi:hypothetical protein